MVPSSPFVWQYLLSAAMRIGSLAMRMAAFSCPWMWRSGEVYHMEQNKRGNRRFLDGRRCCLFWLLSQNRLADACQWMCCCIPCQLVSHEI